MNNPDAKGARNLAIAAVMSLSTLVNLSVIAIVSGCGGADLDVDKAALYTPDSLATEFAIGFKALRRYTRATAGKVKTRTQKNRPAPVFSENARKEGKTRRNDQKERNEGTADS